MMFFRIALAIFFLCSGLNPALAKRVALVIGNGAYISFTSLPNPVNDARLMERTLRDVGFEVTVVLNADEAKMKKAMLDFGRTLRKGVDASLFYYAGHGVQVEGKNYLIPTTATIEDEDEVGIQAIDVNEFLRTMESAKSPFNIVVLDACRNNPLNSGRGGGGGLAPVNAPKGSYIAYATAPGAIAEDGESGNSPYTAALVSLIGTPGLKLEDVFKKTREIVLVSTNEKQVPWETSSITGDFTFKAASGVNPITPQISSIDADFSLARSLGTEAAWDLFLARHGTASDMRVDVARQERDKLAMADLPKSVPIVPEQQVINMEEQQKTGDYLFDILKKPTYRARWLNLIRSYKLSKAKPILPAWLLNYADKFDGPAAPGTSLSIDGRNVKIYWVCETHNCGNFFVVLFDGKSGPAKGVWVDHDAEPRFLGSPSPVEKKALLLAAR